MEEYLPEMQSTLEPVNLSDDASFKPPDDEKSGKTSGMEDCSSISCAGGDAGVLERESSLLPSDQDSAAVGISSNGAPAEGQQQSGGADCSASACCERQAEGSTKPEHLPSEELERHDPKINQTEQSFMEILQDLREESDFVKKSSDKIYSESPYDTDCTKKLISTIHQTSSQEDLLKEIESELLSMHFSKRPKLPNGVQKGEHALAVFEKCVQDKYLQQEQTITK